jgi:benzoyl-CoA reductase/2-hydroxyglutaryl-CoA dehydratase subunit BcrC/BadD/HgdB
MSSLKEIMYFHGVLKNAANFDSLAGKHPLVGCFCNVVPEEMILACGAVPVRLCCMDAACARQGEQIMPAEICPMIKAVHGFMENTVPGAFSLIVAPGTCDNKAHLYQYFKEKVKMYFLDLPRENDYLKNSEIWVEQFRSFYDFLKQELAQNPSRSDLLKACRVTNRRADVFRRIEELRAQNPQLINNLDYFAMASASFYALPQDWTREAEHLLGEARNKQDKSVPPAGRKKILLAGAPLIYPHFKIFEILGQAGCDVAADVLCSAHGRLADPVVIDEETEEGMVRALALKHVAASMCPCFLSLNKVIDHIQDRVKTLKLDGVVFHSLRLCHLFDVQAQMLRQALKSADIPFLIVKSDLGGEDLGQLKTRVEAFREMLEEGR